MMRNMLCNIVMMTFKGAGDSEYAIMHVGSAPTSSTFSLLFQASAFGRVT